MLSIRVNFLRTTLIVAGLAATALAVVALEIDDVEELCMDFLENHLDEPKWEKACLTALEQLES